MGTNAKASGITTPPITNSAMTAKEIAWDPMSKLSSVAMTSRHDSERQPYCARHGRNRENTRQVQPDNLPPAGTNRLHDGNLPDLLRQQPVDDRRHQNGSENERQQRKDQE